MLSQVKKKIGNLLSKKIFLKIIFHNDMKGASKQIILKLYKAWQKHSSGQ